MLPFKMIEGFVALYFSLGLILVSFGPAKLNIDREVDKIRDFKSTLRSLGKLPSNKKIMLFRLIITAGFILMWPFFLPGALKDNQKSADIALFNNLKRSIKGKKFKCPKCKNKTIFKRL